MKEKAYKLEEGEKLFAESAKVKPEYKKMSLFPNPEWGKRFLQKIDYNKFEKADARSEKEKQLMDTMKELQLMPQVLDQMVVDYLSLKDDWQTEAEAKAFSKLFTDKNLIELIKKRPSLDSYVSGDSFELFFAKLSNVVATYGNTFPNKSESEVVGAIDRILVNLGSACLALRNNKSTFKLSHSLDIDYLGSEIIPGIAPCNYSAKLFAFNFLIFITTDSFSIPNTRVSRHCT